MNEVEAMIEKTRVMLSMQNEMNSHVDADWLEREREWYRAIWIECAELMEHYGGWKWWKHATPDFAQVVLEIVDIWHFGMSMRFDGVRGTEAIAEGMLAELAAEPSVERELREAVEDLAGLALVERRFSMRCFCTLMDAAGMDFDALFAAYVGKNVLNFFRQDNGYKDGSYRKLWQGREDNAHLAEILLELDSRDASYADQLYAALAGRYASA